LKKSMLIFFLLNFGIGFKWEYTSHLT